MTPLVDVLLKTDKFLRERGVGTPRLDAELLLCHVLGVDRVKLYLLYDRPLSDEELAKLRPLVARRGKREPLAWILGTQGFWKLDLTVGSGVLVPRPDTETLVEAVLERIPADVDPVYVADIGCGSGAIGLAIAADRPNVRVYSVDIAPEPLRITKLNRDALGLEKRVAVLEGDLLAAIPHNRPIDWVVSNPPYIPSGDIDGLMPEVSQWEPRRALDGGRDGYEIYRRLIPEAAQRARRGIALEVGQGQAGQVADLLRKEGFKPTTKADLAGIERVVIAEW